MSVSNVNNLNKDYALSDTSKVRNTGELGKDEFLKLFVEQLKSQDPLSPMDNNEFIAQSAQFTQLEQMTNLNTNITSFLEQQSALMNSVLYAQTSTQALDLVGKQVTAFVANENDGFDKVEGIVDKITFNGDYQVLHVGGKEVFLQEVAEVSAPPIQVEEPEVTEDPENEK